MVKIKLRNFFPVEKSMLRSSTPNSSPTKKVGGGYRQPTATVTTTGGKASSSPFSAAKLAMVNGLNSPGGQVGTVVSTQTPQQQGGSTSIKVVCRFRPQNKLETEKGGRNVVLFDELLTAVRISNGDSASSSVVNPATSSSDDNQNPFNTSPNKLLQHQQQSSTPSSSNYQSNIYTFDRIFDEKSTQSDVFSYSAESIVDDIMKGYNGAVLAYGQTGAGKTHTMMGDLESRVNQGLTPRIVKKIFDTIVNSSSDLEFTVKVSFMEIYMERIKDLLQPSNDNLPIHEDKVRGVYVKNLLEIFVSSVEEVFDAMRRGTLSRVVGSTSMNAESSRSHSIFVLHITQKNTLTGSCKTGRLSLVDLAGSEKAGKTGATGQTMEEAKKINKSLSALGMVINSLTDGRSQHIPYRDSKLTRILQESIGGNSRTTLIINCSPSSFNEAETISTLRFGVRAKAIKNNAVINTELSSLELRTLLKQTKSQVAKLQEEISLLGNELSIWRQGGSVARSDWLSIDAVGAKLDGNDTQSSKELLEAKDLLTTPLSLDVLLSASSSDEFFERQNELEDTIADREREIQKLKEELVLTKSELDLTQQREEAHNMTRKELLGNVNNLKIDLERASFENKETEITLDFLKDTNSDLEKTIETLKKAINEKSSTQIRNNDLEIRNNDLEKRLFQLEGEYGRFLELNLNVQDKLIDHQNGLLKRELNVMERKLSTRNERISGLESILGEAQAGFDAKEAYYKEEMEELRLKFRQPAQQDNSSSSNPWVHSSKISKPLRGGGSLPHFVASHTTKSSWYISLLKK